MVIKSLLCTIHPHFSSQRFPIPVLDGYTPPPSLICYLFIIPCVLDVWKQHWNAEPFVSRSSDVLQLPLMWQRLPSCSQGLSQAFPWPKTFRSGFYCQFMSLLWPKHITVLLCPGDGTAQTSAVCKVWLHLGSAAHDGFNVQHFSKPCVCQSLP